MPVASRLPNPEATWERRRRLSVIDIPEVERCLGRRVDDGVVLLSGGLANTNIRVGAVVVRIYRRDPAVAAFEAHLLGRPWASFRVPSVLRINPDSLVLEYVEHGPVLGTAEHGAAVGRALAEVHAVTFESAGHFDLREPTLRIGEPFSDLVGVLVTYAQSELERSGLSTPLRAQARRALDAVAPALRDVAGRPVLLHADFKASNLHWATDDRLLVLDWEFAYAGAALSDVGQLLRWEPPRAFIEAFATSYRAHGGTLDEGWERFAAAFDLVNLAGLAANLVEPVVQVTSNRVRDVENRIRKTLALLS